MCLTTLVLHFVVIVQLLQSPFISEIGDRKGEIIAVFTAGASGMGGHWARSNVLAYFLMYSRYSDCWFSVLLPST